MTEESPAQPGADGTAGDAEAAHQTMAPLMIGAQYIKDLSFENPIGPEVMSALQESPRVNVEVNTSARPLVENTFEVTLFIRGEATVGDKSVFIVELTYGGIVSVHDVPEESVRPLVLIEGPRHLFPFARSVIANVTRDGGFPPLMINPVDFAGLYLQQHGTEEGTAFA